MSTKHTEGPWIAEADEDSDLGEFTIKTTDGDYIADVRNPYCDYDMQVAYAQSDDCRIEHDARLIAAAPELLSALKALRDECSGTPRPWVLVDLLTDATEALAKVGA